MILLKDELRVLKTMETTPLEQPRIPNFRKLYEANIIHDVYTDQVDRLGCEIPSGKYTVTDEYWRYMARRKERLLFWLVPVAISAAALLISFVALFK